MVEGFFGAIRLHGERVPAVALMGGSISEEQVELRDELLDGEVFYSLAEAKIVIEGWRRHYNASRPHSALGYRPPAPEVVPWPAPPATQAVAPKPLMH